MVTDLPRRALVVTGGDCAPICVVDEVRHVIGIAHSGRKGTLGDIAGKLVDKMKAEFGSDPRDLVAAIGPGICGAHYPVPSDVVNAFLPTFVANVSPSSESGMSYLELRGIIADQLFASGIAQDRIHLIDECTLECPGTWFSYRRDRRDGHDEQDLRVQAFVCWMK